MKLKIRRKKKHLSYTVADLRDRALGTRLPLVLINRRRGPENPFIRVFISLSPPPRFFVPYFTPSFGPVTARYY